MTEQKTSCPNCNKEWAAARTKIGKIRKTCR
jgi:hypothetical protein